jgi:transcriptional regulator with XRE-family HTH domain
MNTTIGDRIKNLREKHNWTQKELAKKTNINVSVLNRIELNTRPVRDDELVKFADVFDVSADYLIGRGMESENNSTSLVKEMASSYGIDQISFFDVKEWENLSKEEIELIKNHFDMVVKMAKSRKNK